MTGALNYRRPPAAAAPLASLDVPASVRIAEAALAKAEAIGEVKAVGAARTALVDARAAWLVDVGPTIAGHRAAAAGQILRGLDDVAAGFSALRELSDFCRRHGLPPPQPFIAPVDLGELQRQARVVLTEARRRTPAIPGP